MPTCAGSSDRSIPRTAERAVLWTDTARDNLSPIVEYIADDNVTNALRVLDRLEGQAAALALHAERRRIVPELHSLDVHHYRELVEHPWRIVYRIEAERVLMLAVLNGRRDSDSTLIERLVKI